MNRDSSMSPIRILSILKNRRLIMTLVRREVAARYRGSLFGNLWALFTPLFMLAVYTLIFREGANKSYGTRAFTGNPLILND